MPAAAPSLGIRMLMASARSTPGRPSDLRALGERASIRWFYGLRGLVPHRGSLSCGSVNTTTCSMVVGRGPQDVCGVGLVPHTGFEPVISALRGRCPGPLDECGKGLADQPEQGSRRAGMIPAAGNRWQLTRRTADPVLAPSPKAR